MGILDPLQNIVQLDTPIQPYQIVSQIRPDDRVGNVLYNSGQNGAVFFDQMSVQTAVDKVTCDVCCNNANHDVTVKVYVNTTTSYSTPLYSFVIPAAKFPHSNIGGTDFYLPTTVNVPANSYFFISFESASTGEMIFSYWNAVSSNPARHNFILPSSLPITSWFTASSVWQAGLTLWSKAIVTQTQVATYSHPRSPTEFTGNFFYSASAEKVLGFYETMASDTLFNTFKCNIYCTNAARTIQMLIYSLPSASTFNPSTTPPIYVSTIAAGKFPSATGPSTFKLGTNLKIPAGNTIFILFYNAAQTTTELNIAAWNTAASSPARHGFILQTALTTTFAIGTTPAFGQSAIELDYYTKVPTLIQKIFGWLSAINIFYDPTTSGAIVYTVQDAIDYLFANGSAGGGSAASTTYSNTTSGLNASNVQTAIDLLAPVVPVVTIILSSQMYATEGIEFNAYFRNFVFSNIPYEDLGFDITCVKGTQYQDFWRYTPISSDAGNTAFTIDVYYKGVKIATASSTLYTTALTKSGTISVLCAGDSTTAGGSYISIIPKTGDALAMTFKGTQTASPNSNEGYGGYSWASFATAAVPLYQFNVTGVTTPPGVGSTYTTAGNTYSITEINISGGTGYVKGTLSSGVGTPGATGTLTRSSGTGDATISYTAYTPGSGNPFWNVSTGMLDFANYLTTKSITLASGDYVTFLLGINDVFNNTTDSANAISIANVIIYVNALITNIQATVPGIKIVLLMTTPPSISQDAAGANYGDGQTRYRYLINIQQLWAAYLSNFDTSAMQTAKVWVSPLHLWLDSANNMQTASQVINARNSNTITRQINLVHPATTGYNQMGDSLYATLKNLS